METLQRDADCNSRTTGISAVIKVIAVVDIVNVHIIGLIPVCSPIFRVGINNTHPIATVLKARKSTDNQEGQAEDME
jgi:hypothetical protein